MATYDRKIIYEFADRLYDRAGTVILTYTLVGILAGGAFYPFSKTTGILLAVLFGTIGFLIGNEKAFWYKLQAQITLCQAKIEENTSDKTIELSTNVARADLQKHVTRHQYNKACPKCGARQPDDIIACPECDIDLVPST